MSTLAKQFENDEVESIRFEDPGLPPEPTDDEINDIRVFSTTPLDQDSEIPDPPRLPRRAASPPGAAPRPTRPQRPRPPRVAAEPMSRPPVSRDPNTVVADTVVADGHDTPPPRQGSRRKVVSAQSSHFDRAKAQLSPERQEALERLRDEFAESKDSIIWRIVEALSFSESFLKSIPEDMRSVASEIHDAQEQIATKAVDSLGGALARIDHDKLGANIAASTIKAVKTQFSVPMMLKWGGVGAAVALGILILGIVMGRSMDIGGYRAAYIAQLANVPHVQGALSTPGGQRFLNLAQYNDPGILDEIASCSPALGLQLQRTATGARVCAGKGASHGWWPAP
jgi:ElaB/YqjD/DUF883 family membrane-anchored ribosome-binding protein